MLQQSRIVARYSQPWPVGTYEMSATHSRSSSFAVNSRFTRSGCGASPGRRRVRPRGRRDGMPCRPAARIRRATRFCEQNAPSYHSSACTLGRPYVAREASWMRTIARVSSASAICLADGGRERQA